MSSTGSYKARQFNLSGLKGISDQTLEMHFKLYEGYVKETNNLTTRIAEFIQDGNVVWQLRNLEGRFRRHRKDARRGLGHLLSESHKRKAFKPLDHVARNRQCCRLYSDP